MVVDGGIGGKRKNMKEINADDKLHTLQNSAFSVLPCLALPAFVSTLVV